MEMAFWEKGFARAARRMADERLIRRKKKTPAVINAGAAEGFTQKLKADADLAQAGRLIK